MGSCSENFFKTGIGLLEIGDAGTSSQIDAFPYCAWSNSPASGVDTEWGVGSCGVKHGGLG